MITAFTASDLDEINDKQCARDVVAFYLDALAAHPGKHPGEREQAERRYRAAHAALAGAQQRITTPTTATLEMAGLVALACERLARAEGTTARAVFDDIIADLRLTELEVEHLFEHGPRWVEHLGEDDQPC